MSGANTSCTGTSPSPLYSTLVLISVNFGCFLTFFTGAGETGVTRLLSSVRRRFLAVLLSSCTMTGVFVLLLCCLSRFLERSVDELRLLAACLSEIIIDSVREDLRGTLRVFPDGVRWGSESGVEYVVFLFWWTASRLSMRSSRASS